MSIVQQSGSGAPEERRRQARQSIIGRELISVEMPPDNFGLIIDLTEDGAAVQAVATLPSRSHTTLRFTLPGESKPLELKAEVIWSRQNKEAGLRFISPPDEARRTIRNAIALLTQDGLSAEPIPETVITDEFDPARWDLGDSVCGSEPELPFDLQLESIARGAMVSTGASGFAIALLSEGHFVCRTSLGRAPDVGVVLQRDTGLSAECIRTRTAVHCPDTGKDHRVDPDVCRDLGMASAVVLPVNVADDVVALLECFWSTPNAYRDADLNELDRTATWLAELLNAESAEAHFEAAAGHPVPPDHTADPAPCVTTEQDDSSCAVPAHTATAVAESTEDLAAAGDWNTEQELPADADTATELTTERAGSGPDDDFQSLTGSLTQPSGGRQVFTAGLIGIAAFVLFTIPITWYLLQRNAVPSQNNEQSKVSEASMPSDREAVDSIELPLLSSVTPPGSIRSAEQGASSASEPHPRSVVVTTTTVRPSRAGDFQPLRLIHESPMPASAIRVAGAMSRGAGQPRSIGSVAPAPPQVNADPSYRRGTVILDVSVTRGGAVEDVRVISGDPLLAEAAKAAVSHWRYQPATMDGSPIQGNARVTVRFQPGDNNR